MSKNSLVARIYGYTMCLLTGLTFLFALPMGIAGVLNYLNPEKASGAPSILKTDFSQWKDDYLRSISTDFFEGEEGNHYLSKRIYTSPIPSDSTLEALFVQKKHSEVEAFQHRLITPVVQQAFLSLISAGLFVFHWRWLSRAKQQVSMGTT